MEVLRLRRRFRRRLVVLGDTASEADDVAEGAEESESDMAPP